MVALVAALGLAACGDVRGVIVPVSVVWGAVVLLSPGTPPGPAWAWAIAVRLALLACAPTLSDDVFRYVWEGRVWLAGGNPFVQAPDDPSLAALRDAAWAQVNHRAVPSVYPPLAQALFAALAPRGVLAWRVLSAACDVGTVALLSRRDPRAGWIWALLPLPAIESAISGHLEGIGILLLVVALRGGRAAAAAAWAGAMVKLLPGVLLPLERPRAWLAWGALTVAACLPIVRADGFRIYQEKWSYNGSIFPIAEAAFGDPARSLLQALGAALAGVVLWRVRDRGRVALWICGAFVLLSPTVHPWYVLWPLAASLWNGARAWTLLAALVPVSYAVLASYDPATSAWSEPAWVRWVIYPPFFVALIAEGWARATRPGPAPVH